MSDHYIEEKNLSHAWARAMSFVSAKGKKEVAPLIVSITGFDDGGNFSEDQDIREAVDKLLSKNGKQSVKTVASTIFPYWMWNPNAPRQQLFERYAKIFPSIQKANSLNQYGIYFERMITGGHKKHPNQLGFLLDKYTSRKGARRSMLQIGIFDPKRDQNGSALRGFPCLQHVTFAPVGKELTLNAFYATQYMGERAYGNYVGLCNLGQFVASELELSLSRVTCYTGIAQCEMSKTQFKPILDLLKE